MWIRCRACPAEGHVYWFHPSVEVDTWTCYHHARTDGPHLLAVGWERGNEDEWLEEPSRLVTA